MKQVLLYPSEWTLADPSKVVALFKRLSDLHRGRKSISVSSTYFTVDVSPLDLYCYLKFRFGPPNGFAMSLKTPTIDNLIQWHYTLASGETIIDIMGLNFRTSISFYECLELIEEDWRTLETNLLREFETKRGDLANVRDGLENWHLFINPYKRLSLIVDRYLRRLEELNLDNVEAKIPKPIEYQSDPQAYSEIIRECEDIYREASAICVSIQMIAPVMGEAAVNFVALMLAKNEVKNDRRLYEDFVRRNIDVRIKSLSILCDGFEKAIDGSEKSFKDFLRLMNRRNDTLHGNIDPRKSVGEEIFFDLGNIPIVRRHSSIIEIALSNALAHVEPRKAIEDVRVVRSFVRLLLDCLLPKYRKIVEIILDDLQPGYNPKTKRIGAILSPIQVDIIPA